MNQTQKKITKNLETWQGIEPRPLALLSAALTLHQNVFSASVKL